jgi:hypothetical protein
MSTILQVLRDLENKTITENRDGVDSLEPFDQKRKRLSDFLER